MSRPFIEISIHWAVIRSFFDLYQTRFFNRLDMAYRYQNQQAVALRDLAYEHYAYVAMRARVEGACPWLRGFEVGLIEGRSGFYWESGVCARIVLKGLPISGWRRMLTWFVFKFIF